MDFAVRKVPVLRPEGSIVASKCLKLSDDILFLLSSDCIFAILDMGDITFLSKQTIVMLINLREKFEQANGYLALSNPRDVVKNLISLRRSQNGVDFFHTTLEAEAHIIEEFGDVDFVYINNVVDFQLSLARHDKELFDDEADLRDEEESLAALSALAEREEAGEKHIILDDVGLDDVIDREIILENSLSDQETASGFSYEEAVSSVELSEPSESPVDSMPGSEIDEVDDKSCSLLSMSDSQLSNIVKAHKETKEPAFDFILEPDPLSDTAANRQRLLDVNNELESESIEPAGVKIFSTDSINSAVDCYSSDSIISGPDSVQVKEVPELLPQTNFSVAEAPSEAPLYLEEGGDFEALCIEIRSDDPKKRWYAARSLGRLEDTRGIAILEKLLKSGDDFSFIKDMARLSLIRLNKLYNPMIYI